MVRFFLPRLLNTAILNHYGDTGDNDALFQLSKEWVKAL